MERFIEIRYECYVIGSHLLMRLPHSTARLSGFVSLSVLTQTVCDFLRYFFRVLEQYVKMGHTDSFNILLTIHD
jgi:hypothetical protein